jgi:hypothetical protein
MMRKQLGAVAGQRDRPNCKWLLRSCGQLLSTLEQCPKNLTFSDKCRKETPHKVPLSKMNKENNTKYWVTDVVVQRETQRHKTQLLPSECYERPPSVRATRAERITIDALKVSRG